MNKQLLIAAVALSAPGLASAISIQGALDSTNTPLTTASGFPFPAPFLGGTTSSISFSETTIASTGSTLTYDFGIGAGGTTGIFGGRLPGHESQNFTTFGMANNVNTNVFAHSFDSTDIGSLAGAENLANGNSFVDGGFTRPASGNYSTASELPTNYIPDNPTPVAVRSDNNATSDVLEGYGYSSDPFGDLLFGSLGPITVVFDNEVSAVGAVVGALNSDAFVKMIAYDIDGMVIGIKEIMGILDPADPGNAGNFSSELFNENFAAGEGLEAYEFLGLEEQNNLEIIKAVSFVMVSGDPGGFALDEFVVERNLSVAPPAGTVPVPATGLLMAFVGLLGLRLRKRS